MQKVITVYKNFWRRCTILLVVGTFMLPAPSFAINFSLGSTQPDGFLLNLFPFWYSANKITDKKGNTAVDKLGLDKYGVNIVTNYYTGSYLFSTYIPVGKLDVGSVHDSDAGLGDIQLRVGKFLPIESVTILPVLMLKTPTGSYDKSRPVNYGDGQADLAAELYFFKLFGPFSLDALAKYTIRFHNSRSDVTPGNELALEGLATWKIADKVRIGPAFNFVLGDDRKKGGKVVQDSGLMRLSAGGEIYYGRNSLARVSLALYKDVLTHNTNEGVLVMSRITIPF